MPRINEMHDLGRCQCEHCHAERAEVMADLAAYDAAYAAQEAMAALRAATSRTRITVEAYQVETVNHMFRFLESASNIRFAAVTAKEEGGR